MGEEFKDIVMGHIKKDIFINSLKKGQRFDGRAFDEFRAIQIQKEVIASAEGSALAEIGLTKVLVGIKFDVVNPFPDRPQEGVFMTNAELLPLASSTFEAGPPDENSIELARVVDRGIRSSETIDINSFFIEDGKVLALYLDIYVLDHSGNLIDAAGLAAAAALTATKMPKIENNKVVRGEYTGPLKLKSIPVTTTFAKVADYWIVDTTRDEEVAIDTRLTIATTKDHVCAIQKGDGSLKKDELMERVDMAFKKGNELRKLLGH